MKTGTSIKEEEEISESMKVKERFTDLPGHTEESEMGVKMAPVLGSGASSPCTGSSASPTGISSSSRAASRTRTPFEGGRRIYFKSAVLAVVQRQVLRKTTDAAKRKFCVTNGRGRPLIFTETSRKIRSRQN